MDFNKYKNTKPFATHFQDVEVHDAWAAEERRLAVLFKTDALADVGLTAHPKADKAFGFAWEHGHANGLSEVHYWLQEMADLLLD